MESDENGIEAEMESKQDATMGVFWKCRQFEGSASTGVPGSDGRVAGLYTDFMQQLRRVGVFLPARRIPP